MCCARKRERAVFHKLVPQGVCANVSYFTCPVRRCGHSTRRVFVFRLVELRETLA